MNWTFAAGDLLPWSAPTIGADGTIYIAGSDNLYAINPDGSEEWALAGAGLPGTFAAPAIGSDGTIYVGSGGSLVAVSPGGSLNWTFIASDLKDSPPAIGADGTIYVRGGDNLYAVNPDGSLKWVNDLVGGPTPDPLAIAADGTIYAVLGGSLAAVNPDGSLKWNSGANGLTGGPAIGADGTIYVDGQAFHPDGTAGIALPSVLTVAADFQPSTGLSPAIGADGTVYLSGADYGLTCIYGGGTFECTPYAYLYAIGPAPTPVPSAIPTPTPTPTPTATPTPTPMPLLALVPPAVSFGNITVNTPATSLFTVTNTGASLSTGGVSADGISAPFSLLSGGGAFSLTSQQSIIVTIRFAPTAPGPFSGFLTITSGL